MYSVTFGETMATNTRKRVSSQANGQLTEFNGNSNLDVMSDEGILHKKQRVEDISTTASANGHFTPTQPLEINQDPDRVLFA